MRTLAFFATSVIASLAVAQSPLNFGVTPNNQGNAGGGIYFDLTVNTTVTLTTITYITGANATLAGNSNVELYVGPSTYVGNVTPTTPPGVWTLVGATAPVPVVAGQQTITAAPLMGAGANPGTVTFVPGTYGIALRSIGHAWAYLNGAVTYSTAELSATVGGASNAFLVAPTFSPRGFVGSLAYTLGGTPMPFAQRSPYGAGCYANHWSFYELFPSSANVDLSNTSMYMAFDGGNNRYSSIVAGTSPLFTPTSPDLVHGDNTNVTVNLGPTGNPQPILFPNGNGGIGVAAATVEMSANGYINLLGTNPLANNPTLADFLSGTPRIGNWYDMDPPGTATTPANPPGSTHYDYDAATGSHVFTWLNCSTRSIAGSLNTFQLAFFSNGDIEFRWGAMSQLGGGTWPTLIGFTPGANSLDSGSLDLSVRLSQLPPLSTSNVDRNAFTLTASSNPVLGTTVNLVASDPSAPGVGVTFIGVADLAPFSPVGLPIPGASGCVANVNINPAVSVLISNLGGPFPGMSVAFPIPALPLSLVGQSFYCQSIWIDDLGQNNFFGGGQGLLTSNAVRLKLGQF